MKEGILEICFASELLQLLTTTIALKIHIGASTMFHFICTAKLTKSDIYISEVQKMFSDDC